MSEQQQKHGQILAVVNRKGGVAKTTTSINLAHGLSRKLLYRVNPQDLGKISDSRRLYQYGDNTYYIEGHVLLIDLDSQGHCAKGLGISTESADIGELLLGRQHLSQAVVSADRARDGYPRPNLWILPASDNLEFAKEEIRQQALVFMANGHTVNESLLMVLEQRLRLAVERFDYVILDCAPTLDTFARAVYRLADAAIVPVKPDYFSMAGADQHIADIRQAQLRGIEIAIHTIVPTFTVIRQRLDREMIRTLQQQYGEKVSAAIPRSQAIAEAPAHHQTIFEYDPKFKNPATIAYQQLVDRVYDGK